MFGEKNRQWIMFLQLFVSLLNLLLLLWSIGKIKDGANIVKFINSASDCPVNLNSNTSVKKDVPGTAFHATYGMKIKLYVVYHNLCS